MPQDETQRTFEPFNPDGQSSTRLTTGQGQTDSVAKPYISDDKLKPGDIIGDSYVIIELIGVGGMGYVYKVRHLILEKMYAMKTISGEQISEIAWRRLQVEAQAIARINHPNIVGIHNLGIHQGKIPYYVMDYLKGKNLAEILKQKRYLTLEQSLPLFIEICNGLGFAHKKGIVHRDMKPGNIVILDEPDFTGGRVKIVDFGIAKLAGTIDPVNQKLTTIGEVFGSPLYMSPEQCEGKRIDARSDIYSLGCTFFEILTGEVPFHGENPVATMLLHSQVEPPSLYEASGLDFPESMEHLVATMLAKAPMNRYPNLERVGDDLQNILDGNTIGMSPFNTSINLNLFSDQFEDNAIDDEVGEEEIVLVKSKRVKLKTIAIAGSLLVVGALLIAAYSIYFKTAAKSQTVAKAPVAVPIASDGTQRYFSSSFDGGRTIRFEFPKEQSLGTIGYSSKKSQQEAKGTVVLEPQKQIHFAANEYILTHPKLIDSFRPDDLYAFNAPEQENAIKMDEPMAHIAKLTGLKKLNLKTNRATDAIVPYLDQLTSLESLNLDMTHVTGAGLAKFKGLKKLKQLFFSYNHGVPDLLQALRGSEELENLYIESPDMPFTTQYAKLLADCPKLKHLDLQASKLNDEGLYILAALPNIDFIDATDCQVTDEAVNKIKAARKGKKIHIPTKNDIEDKNAFDNESPAVWIK